MDKTEDEKRFNDALKRMLKTPPKPHEKTDSVPKSDKKKPAKRRTERGQA
jgi:hypothetical protein